MYSSTVERGASDPEVAGSNPVACLKLKHLMCQVLLSFIYMKNLQERILQLELENQILRGMLEASESPNPSLINLRPTSTVTEHTGKSDYDTPVIKHFQDDCDDDFFDKPLGGFHDW